jgi:acyl-CoA thioester hydrolase
MVVNKTELRVYYSDTDKGQVVYYANYLKWFEIGRTELLRQYSFNYADFEKQGILAPVVEVKCGFKTPARYDDAIIIETKIENMGNSSIKFYYKILRKEDKELLADGYSVNVFINKDTMKSVNIPEDLRKTFR